jgi:LDH2 family malate/lactate/ureidoglycolate dehydrogenase
MVGNNPMAIAFPSTTGEALVVDMAMSATAMGKIRLAQAQGQSIPAGWATDAQGNSTTSATEAINGMLLPAAGPKGFGRSTFSVAPSPAEASVPLSVRYMAT